MKKSYGPSACWFCRQTKKPLIPIAKMNTVPTAAPINTLESCAFATTGDKVVGDFDGAKVGVFVGRVGESVGNCDGLCVGVWKCLTIVLGDALV